MKIDRGNITHWMYLVLFGMNVALAIAVRPFRKPGARKRLLLYGHRLGGNLLAIYSYLRTSPDKGIDVAYLTLDPSYYRELLARGESCVLATSPRCIRWLATADAIVSDHGLHAMLPMLTLSDVKFFDVWHGIPYKGFDADDFRVQHRYDEVWVSSPLLRQMYVERFGFPADIVEVTGYARTDRLVHRVEDPVEIKRRLGLDPSSRDKLVLFAPTWKQDAQNRSVFPFGLGEQAFLAALSQLGARLGATFLLRAHLNSDEVADHGLDHIVALPHARFPDTEEILLVTDVLVCDWSSIAFDYLLLDRPTIFLDVEAPFAKGFSLGPDYRFGAIAADMDALMERLEQCLLAPADYRRKFTARHAQIKARVYGDCADGNATARCVERLARALARSQSSR